MTKYSFSVGFQLLEILITLTLIGIISSIGLPLYSHYLQHARRLEANTALLNLAVALEQYHLEHNTYQHASLPALHCPEWIAKNNYQLIIQSATNDDYLLIAKPHGTQAKQDTNCALLTINAEGKKGNTGPYPAEECWS